MARLKSAPFPYKSTKECSIPRSSTKTLNFDTLINILSFLTHEQIASCALVSHFWCNATRSPLIFSFLDLSKIFFKVDDTFLVQIVFKTNRFNLLHTLILDDCAITDKTILLVTQKCPNLKVVSFKNCPNVSETAVLNLLSKCSSIEILLTSSRISGRILKLIKTVYPSCNLGEVDTDFRARKGIKTFSRKGKVNAKCGLNFGSRVCWGEITGLVMYSNKLNDLLKGPFPEKILFSCEAHQQNILDITTIAKCMICERFLLANLVLEIGVCVYCKDRSILDDEKNWIDLAGNKLLKDNFLGKFIDITERKNLPRTLRKIDSVHFDEGEENIVDSMKRTLSKIVYALTAARNMGHRRAILIKRNNFVEIMSDRLENVTERNRGEIEDQSFFLLNFWRFFAPFSFILFFTVIEMALNNNTNRLNHSTKEYESFVNTCKIVFETLFVILMCLFNVMSFFEQGRRRLIAYSPHIFDIFLLVGVFANTWAGIVFNANLVGFRLHFFCCLILASNYVLVASFVVKNFKEDTISYRLVVMHIYISTAWFFKNISNSLLMIICLNFTIIDLCLRYIFNFKRRVFLTDSIKEISPLYFWIGNKFTNPFVMLFCTMIAMSVDLRGDFFDFFIALISVFSGLAMSFILPIFNKQLLLYLVVTVTNLFLKIGRVSSMKLFERMGVIVLL